MPALGLEQILDHRQIFFDGKMAERAQLLFDDRQIFDGKSVIVESLRNIPTETILEGLPRPMTKFILFRHRFPKGISVSKSEKVVSHYEIHDKCVLVNEVSDIPFVISTEAQAREKVIFVLVV